MSYALTEGQKEFIRATLSHLLDFPDTENELKATVTTLKQALEEAELPEQHEYGQLQKCYFTPTAYFHRLEHLNPDISIGLVQEYILELICDCLANAARDAHTTEETLEWNPLPYLERLHRLENIDAFETTFRSQPLIFDSGEHPWQIPVHPGKIFTAEFLQMNEFRLLQVKIQVDLPGWRPLQGETIEYPDYIETDEDEDDFMREQQPLASKEAEQRVIDSLLHHLVATTIITPSQRVRASSGAKLLLVHRFYFDAISTGKIPFADLMQLGLQQAENLSESAVKSLIQAGKCDIASAKQFTPSELAVLKNPFYSHEIIHDRIELLALKNISKSQSQVLNIPGVIYLQRKGKISFGEAKTISIEAAPLFKSELCIQLIMENKLTFQDAKRLKANEALLLTESFYAGEIFQERLTLPEIKHLSSEEISRLLFPPLIELQKRHKISRAAAQRATTALCTILEDAFYFTLILEDHCAFVDLSNLNPHQATTLLHPKIKELIRTGALRIEDALLLSGKEREILVMPPILKLFQTRKLNLGELHKVPFAFAKLLGKNICLYGLLAQKVLTIEESLSSLQKGELLLHPLTQWGLCLGGRLIGLFKNQPYYENGEADDIHLLKKDLERISELNPAYSRKILCGQTLKVFFHYLQRELSHEREKNKDRNSLYAQFLMETLLAENPGQAEEAIPHPLDCLQTINRLAHLAQQKIQFFETNPELHLGQRGRMAFSLFTPVNPHEDLERIRNFQKKLEQVTFLANAYEARGLVRSLSH